jgi:glycogen debranching enzyme
MHYHHNFVKPPVHGWALRFVLARSGKVFERRLLEDMYEVMSRWASWWLDHRRYKDQALPYYLHGNDSGWDNSTMFDEGVPLVAPDLAAFLAEHCETLSVVAATLRRKRESAHWHAQSQELVTALMRELWREDHFIARRALDGHEVHCDSLITCMPLLLGKRLPEHVRNALIKRLQRHLTEWGLATEPPDSPHYDSDGYWRGPIWAPSTMLLVDALARCEQTEMARDISRRFCRLCAKSDFAENFDALSGEARRDTAYTWTASVFLVLAQEYLMGDGEPQD